MQSIRWFAAALALVGAAAFAAEDQPTKEEREAGRAAAFAQADADRNGALSAEEFSAFKDILHRQRGQDWFSKIDANGDGQVSLQELQEAGARKRDCHRGEHGA